MAFPHVVCAKRQVRQSVAQQRKAEASIFTLGTSPRFGFSMTLCTKTLDFPAFFCSIYCFTKEGRKEGRTEGKRGIRLSLPCPPSWDKILLCFASFWLPHFTTPCWGRSEIILQRDELAAPIAMASNLIASLLLVAMPFAPSSFLFLVVRPGATTSVLAPNGDGLHAYDSFKRPSSHSKSMRSCQVLDTYFH